MAREITRRIWSAAFALFGLVMFVFVMARLTGNPAGVYLGEFATPAQIKQFNITHGFNKPIVVQLVTYIDNIVHLKFGQSLLYNEPVIHVVLTTFPNTLLLATVTFVACLVVGVLVGTVAAYKEGTLVDKCVTSLGGLALSVPSFWLALLLILVFALKLRLVPTTGMSGPASFALPLLTLFIGNVGVSILVARDSMQAALRSDYVTTAKAKGLRTRTIITKHALRNAAISIITITGASAAGILNGALIVETVFGWPGIGQVVVQSVLGRDFALLQAAVIIIGTAIVVFNLLVDLSYVVLDPRTRRS